MQHTQHDRFTAQGGSFAFTSFSIELTAQDGSTVLLRTGEFDSVHKAVTEYLLERCTVSEQRDMVAKLTDRIREKEAANA